MIIPHSKIIPEDVQDITSYSDGIGRTQNSKVKVKYRNTTTTLLGHTTEIFEITFSAKLRNKYFLI